MKKLIIFVMFLVPFISGCTNIDTTITINPNKSATIVSTLEYEGDLNDSTENSLIINGIYKDFINDTYKTETNFSQKKSVITAEKTIDNIDKEDIDLKSFGFKPLAQNGKFLNIEKKFLAKAYFFEAQYDYADAVAKINQYKVSLLDEAKKMASVSTLIPEYYNKYADPEEVQIDSTNREDFMSNLDDSAKQLTKEDVEDAKEINSPKAQDNEINAVLKIKFPIPIIGTNADSVLGTTYIWNITKDKPTIIKVRYIDYNTFAMFFIIFIGIGFLVYIAIRVTRHDILKRIENDDVPKMSPDNKLQ